MAKNNNNLIGALDVGTSKICALIAEIDEMGNIDILGEGTVISEGIRGGIIADMESATKCMESAMQKAEDNAHVEMNEIIVGIAGKNIKCQNNRAEVIVASPLRGITDGDVKKVESLAYNVPHLEGQMVVNSLTQEFFVDDEVIGLDRKPIGMVGNRLSCQAHIIHCSAAIQQNLTRCVNSAGWNVRGMVLQSLASSLAILTNDEKKMGVVMVDIGAGTMDISIYQQGGLRHSQIIQMGGNQITSDIAYALQIKESIAETFKRSEGAAITAAIKQNTTFEITRMVDGIHESIPRMRMVEIIQPRLLDMFTLVKQELEQMQRCYPNPTGMVITGGCTNMQGIRELASKYFGMPVRVGLPTGVQNSAGFKLGAEHSTAVGLLLSSRNEYDVKKSSNVMDMFPRVSKTLDKGKKLIQELF